MKHQASGRMTTRQHQRQPKQRRHSESRSAASANGVNTFQSKTANSGKRSRKAVRRSRPQPFAIAISGIGRFIQTGLHTFTHRRIVGQPVWLLGTAAAVVSFFAGQGLGMFFANIQRSPNDSQTSVFSGFQNVAIKRPELSPLPTLKETWNCDVIVIGGSLGGVAAASHAMQSGATTCLIELTPWLGGQISSQGVSALDESQEMRGEESFSKSWSNFKQMIAQQPVQLPDWTNVSGKQVQDINSCWVGMLCFPPQAGAVAAEQLLKASAARVPASRWATSTAFKGAEFDPSGRNITAVYAVRRAPRSPDYFPNGRLSAELPTWYSWDSTDEFDKVPIRLQAPPGKRLMVIDATDTNELIGWARVPYRLGSDSLATTGEQNASDWDNSDCTQAFTYPFALAIRDDGGASLKQLSKLESVYPKEEHRSDFDLQGFPVFTGRSFFNYRRIVSVSPDDPYQSTPAMGDITAVNWNRGNDWKFMDPPLILNHEQIDQSGQRQNWMGGLSIEALQHGEFHALLFAHWLLEKHTKELPMTYLYGAESPMKTASGLSMYPYIREGRRIVGRRAYHQREFAVGERDLRRDMQSSRDFSPSAIAKIHYSIDIHGCRYREKDEDGEASSASVAEAHVRPTFIPLEALIPRDVDNLLIGGKGIAVTHIANGMTRIHQSEWSIGAVAGATAGWLVSQPQALQPADIVSKRLMPQLKQHLTSQGLGTNLPQNNAQGHFLKDWVARVKWNW